LKPACENTIPYIKKKKKKPFTGKKKKPGGVTQGVGPEFKPQY
jgi:hypothetical protein